MGLADSLRTGMDMPDLPLAEISHPVAGASNQEIGAKADAAIPAIVNGLNIRDMKV